MPAPLYQGPCASFVCCMGISGLGILFDLLWYVLVFGAAAVMAKWMIELHWTRAHTEYVTELLDCGRLSISERCSRVKTAVASIPEWIVTEFSAARRYMAGNMLSVLCLLCVAVPLLLGIAYVKFTPGPLAELIPVSCVDGSELPDYALAEYEFTEPASCYYEEVWEYGQVQARTTVEAVCCFASNDHINWHGANGQDCTAEFIPAIQTDATTMASRETFVKIQEKIKHGILNIPWEGVKYSRHPAAYNGEVHDEAATFAKNSDVFDADTLVGKYVCRSIFDKCAGSHSLCTVEYPEPSTNNDAASDGTEDSGERFMHTVKSISPWKVCQCDEHKKKRQMKYVCRGWRPRDDGTRELIGESSTVIHVDVSLIAIDEDELFVAREMHEILSDKIGRDPDDYGPHSADPEALMDGDGEDSDDVSSDGDVVGDAAVPVVNIMGRPKRAAAQKCDTARKAARNLGYRIRSNR